MAPFELPKVLDKQGQVVFFSATAIALYGYDQGDSLLPCNSESTTAMPHLFKSTSQGAVLAPN